MPFNTLLQITDRKEHETAQIQSNDQLVSEGESSVPPAAELNNVVVVCLCDLNQFAKANLLEV